jgi:hypothetical protein
VRSPVQQKNRRLGESLLDPGNQDADLIPLIEVSHSVRRAGRGLLNRRELDGILGGAAATSGFPS